MGQYSEVVDTDLIQECGLLGSGAMVHTVNNVAQQYVSAIERAAQLKAELAVKLDTFKNMDRMTHLRKADSMKCKLRSFVLTKRLEKAKAFEYEYSRGAYATS